MQDDWRSSDDELQIEDPASRALHGIRLPEDDPPAGPESSFLKFAILAIGGAVLIMFISNLSMGQ